MINDKNRQLDNVDEAMKNAMESVLTRTSAMLKKMTFGWVELAIRNALA